MPYVLSTTKRVSARNLLTELQLQSTKNFEMLAIEDGLNFILNDMEVAFNMPEPRPDEVQIAVDACLYLPMSIVIGLDRHQLTFQFLPEFRKAWGREIGIGIGIATQEAFSRGQSLEDGWGFWTN